MSKVYIIPDRLHMEDTMQLVKEYDATLEFNDFWVPDMLENVSAQEKVIEFYAKYRTDFSQDTMHGAFLDITVHSEDPLIREVSIQRIYQSMEIAKRMGLRAVVFHTGLLSGFRIPSYLKHWEEENIRFFSQLAESYPKQEIYMENMFDESPEELEKLGEAMKQVKNFGICFDYAHSAVKKFPREKWMKALAPYIRHMHINDNDLQEDLHQAVGEGKIDWQEYNSLIEKYRIDASVLVEVKGYEAQKKSLEYLKKYKIYPMNR